MKYKKNIGKPKIYLIDIKNIDFNNITKKKAKELVDILYPGIEKKINKKPKKKVAKKTPNIGSAVISNIKSKGRPRKSESVNGNKPSTEKNKAATKKNPK